MAPGYILAIGLDVSGLLAFALGVALTRYEQREKSVGLKRFLASGQATNVTIAPAPVSRPRRDPSSRRAQSASPLRPEAASEAALALRSAFAVPIR